VAEHAFVGPAGGICRRCGYAHGPVADACPAFPADPVPHRWVAVTVVGAPQQITVDMIEGRSIDVLEVCPSCAQYRTRAYGIVPRDSDGVHSAT
jgi:hypothetical protein